MMKNNLVLEKRLVDIGKTFVLKVLNMNTFANE